MTHLSEYPEHDKLRKVAPLSQAIGEFLDSTPYVLGEYVTREGWRGHTWEEFVPAGRPLVDILAKHFEIDQSRVESEKRAMLASLRGEPVLHQLQKRLDDGTWKPVLTEATFPEARERYRHHADSDPAATFRVVHVFPSR